LKEKAMLESLIPSKEHDEARQGEALLLNNKATDVPNKKLYIESYGCQMNFADSEIVASILLDNGFETTATFSDADVIFINTCSIRENAELRVRKRLTDFKSAKSQKPEMIIGVLGCMAERLKTKFLEEEKLVDLVVGPDAYRDLPNLIEQVEDGSRAVNVLLSREETYADISPVRLNSNGITAFISIMRGCDNMCSFCVVPFTRGRERSRSPESIVKEAKDLFAAGYKEVTLLGQNVDSYKYKENQDDKTVSFANLLALVADIDPQLRVRFSTSHPKDLTDDVLYTIAKYPNVCNHIHLPIQSGNSRILELMNRTYTREWYIDRINAIRNIIPDCGISTDIISGFCSETEEEHSETLSMMDLVQYDFAYMFTYSERPGTMAAKRYADDVPEEVKKRRLTEIVSKQRGHSLLSLQAQIGKTHRVLIEGYSKRSDQDFCGRTDQNSMVVFPVVGSYKIGDYVNVICETCTSATLIGKII